MITAIEIENFKALCKRQRIEIRPVTLLFGPNSGGKSSIIHALHYARELFLRARPDVHRTESGGEFIDLGGLQRLVHGRHWNRQVKLKIEIELSAEDLGEFVVDSELTELLAFDQEEITSQLKRAWVELTIGGFGADPNIIKYSVGLNGEHFASISSVSYEQFLKLTEINWRHLIFLSETERQFAEAARSAELMRQAAVERDLPQQEKAEELRKEADEEVRGALIRLLEQAGEDVALDLELQLSMTPGHRYRRALPMWDVPLEINFPSGDISLASDPSSRPRQDDEAERKKRLEVTDKLAARAAFTELISKLIVGVGQRVRDELEGLRYLGPLRTIPQRHRDVIDPVGPSRWPTGLAAWDLLNESNDTLRKEVSRWMWSDELFASGYQIDRIEFREISDGLQHRMLSAIPVDDESPHVGEFDEVDSEVSGIPVRSKVVLFDLQRDLRLDPHDVGVGISQVIPVVVAALAPGSSLAAVEQPELHVHPRFQVIMGDLLINAATGKSASDSAPRRLLVETHSEHLLLRLLRRVRETMSSTLPAGAPGLKPSELAVYYVEPSDDGSIVRELRVNDDGEFLDPWPDGFFDERGKEFFG